MMQLEKGPAVWWTESNKLQRGLMKSLVESEPGPGSSHLAPIILPVNDDHISSGRGYGWAVIFSTWERIVPLNSTRLTILPWMKTRNAFCCPSHFEVISVHVYNGSNVHHSTWTATVLKTNCKEHFLWGLREHVYQLYSCRPVTIATQFYKRTAQTPCNAWSILPCYDQAIVER